MASGQPEQERKAGLDPRRAVQIASAAANSRPSREQAEEAQRAHRLAIMGGGAWQLELVAAELAQATEPPPKDVWARVAWTAALHKEAERSWLRHSKKQEPSWTPQAAARRAEELIAKSLEQEEERARARAELAAKREAEDQLWNQIARESGLGSAAQAKVLFPSLADAEAAKLKAAERAKLTKAEAEKRLAATLLGAGAGLTAGAEAIYRHKRPAWQALALALGVGFGVRWVAYRFGGLGQLQAGRSLASGFGGLLA